MSGTLWRAEGLGFGYPGQKGLFKDLSLAIGTNQRILLLGANGSGKSTLLKLLMGLEKPVSGSVQLMEKPPGEQDPAIFQNIVFRRQRARDDLFGLLPRHDLEIWQLAFPERFSDEAVKSLEEPLMAKIDEPYTRLSTGELRAFSLLTLPLLKDRFWLLDEPMSNLDPLRRQGFISLCAEKRDAGMLIVSHDPDLPHGLFDRVLKLENGTLRELA